MIPGFQKIFHMFDNNCKNILDGEIEITEKIDGSQFNFGRVDGVVQMRSKGAGIFFEDSNKMFNAAKEFVKSVEDRLPEGVVFHGEYLQSPRHNTLKYDRVPTNHFCLFGITFASDWIYDPLTEYATRESWSGQLGCDSVPVLFRGEIPKGDFQKTAPQYREWLEHELMHKPSYLGGCNAEGIVVKNYAQPCYWLDKKYPLTAAKLVTAEFKEKHVDGWKESNPSALEQIGRAFHCEPRWRKAIQRLSERALLQNSVRDIGPLLKEINNDILEEEQDNIKDMLMKLFWKDIQRIAVKGFPAFYKEYIQEQHQ